MKSVFRYMDKENQYYPTPQKLVKEILGNLDLKLDYIHFLEPCAGDGAICRVVKRYFAEDSKEIDIDCVEIEPVLRDSLKGQGFNVVHEDFETFEAKPIYNLIFMNPPFGKGDEFILKAYELLNAEGMLICILNAETIRNPCNKDRQILKNMIERRGEVHFIENAFSESEHKSDVEIAVVYLKKNTYENEFDMMGGINRDIMTEDEKIDMMQQASSEQRELVPFDKIDNAISIYRNCVKQIFEGINTINQIKTSLLYVEEQAKEFNIKLDDFIKVMLEKEDEEAKEESIKMIRKMVWSYVLKFCQMDEFVFSKQKNAFYDKIDKGSATYPFTRENIKQFFDNIFYNRQSYLKEGIVDLFEEITSKHNGNPYHREGWKTNKNWKINKKIIVNWGMVEFSYDRFHVPYGSRHGWINDLDRVVRKIKMLPGATNIGDALDNKFQNMGRVSQGAVINNEVETAYFKMRFFKKGTLHITFKDQEILNELNSIGAKMRTDLGYDDYGKNI